MVEQGTENPCVHSSILCLGIFFYDKELSLKIEITTQLHNLNSVSLADKYQKISSTRYLPTFKQFSNLPKKIKTLISYVFRAILKNQHFPRLAKIELLLLKSNFVICFSIKSI